MEKGIIKKAEFIVWTTFWWLAKSKEPHIYNESKQEE